MLTSVLLFLGLPPSYESEGWDREDMDLPAEQLDLLRSRSSTPIHASWSCCPTALPLPSPDWAERVPAILEGWLLGQGGGGRACRSCSSASPTRPAG